MTWRRIATTAGFAALMFLGPAGSASANPGWLGWLEELSGPGPFKGYVEGVDAFCLPYPDCLLRQRLESKGVPKRFVTISLEGGQLEAPPGVNPRFNTYVRLNVAEVIVYTPLGTVIDPGRSKLRFLNAIEVGTGFGFLRFSGNGVKHSPLVRTSVPIRIRIVPAELFAPSEVSCRNPSKGSCRHIAYRIARLVYIRCGWDFLGSFSDTDFINTDMTTYRPTKHLPKVRGVALDVGRTVELLRDLKRR